MHNLRARLTLRAARALGGAICALQVRLGRYRHDGGCDRCGEAIDRYGAERLDFPLESLDPAGSTSREKLRAMLDARYECYCLRCAESSSFDWRADP